MRRVLLGAGGAALLLAAASTYLRFGPHARIARDVADVSPTHYALVLGTGRIRDAGEVSPVYAARIKAAVALLVAGKVSTLIISGYRVGAGAASGDYDEIADMREDLVKQGVAASQIIADVGSYRTLDSMRRVACVAGSERIIVVSQAAHLARALFLGWMAGRRDDGFAAAEPTSELANRDMRLEFFARLRVFGDIWPGDPVACGDLAQSK